VKTIRISKSAHAALKVACAKRGLSMKQATEQAIRSMLTRWEQEEQKSQDG